MKNASEFFVILKSTKLWHSSKLFYQKIEKKKKSTAHDVPKWSPI